MILPCSPAAVSAFHQEPRQSLIRFPLRGNTQGTVTPRARSIASVTSRWWWSNVSRVGNCAKGEKSRPGRGGATFLGGC
jgi:hypothetical protein